MNSERWFAAATAVVGLQLPGNACFTAYALDAVRNLDAVPNSPFPSAESVAWAKSLLPALYIAVVEEFLFGAIALVCAVGLFRRSVWARRVLVRASVALAIVAVLVIALAPGQWDTQGIFILFCVLLWWCARKWRTT